MIVYDCVQGSEEWNLLRCGIPTASEFHRILTRGGKKGPQPSGQQWGYLMELLAERRLGGPAENIQTGWMERGHELEAEAVAYYQSMEECRTVKVGFITNDAGTIGASPDRLVLPTKKRGLEIKCPSAAQHMSYLLMEGELADAYFIQVQGQMHVGELEGSDLVSYFPGLPNAMHKTERDEAFIESLDKELKRFCDRLNELDAKVKAIVGDTRPEEQRVNQDSIMQVVREVMIDTQRTA